MFNIYDSTCPVCNGAKKVIVNKYEEPPRISQLVSKRTEAWDYAPSLNERIEEGFCSECGVKFVIG